ncbi:class I SAM-dependent methyltransferase [Streptomyces hesseae]|uniref:Class I SAM-dependent methyltransferase n=1 Tax=Streptomyces hesseae TaxID=3075519 RepID=A0ABU2SP75_9ACTN|nr:class I SAM-dependent methyltransferase [Streptomyces sp. DSM 40473]MDT0450793.1 class I SAM-dependent methyltransferase [Streptomyces sp. DSM 40473]
MDGCDSTAVQAFAGRFLDDVSGGMTSVLCALGDRLGLFRALADGGPAGSPELAARTGLDERPVREWLLGLSSAGYLDVVRHTGEDPADEDPVFSLSPEHAAVLARDDSPFFLGGAAGLVPALAGMLEPVAETFRSGGGVPQEAYPEALYRTMWRMSASWLGTLLLPQWIPAVDGLAGRLAAGGRVAHLGSGGGHALVLIAGAFPRARCTGYDRLRLHVDRARREAADAGVADRVEFVHGDAADLLPGTGDHALVLALDVLHDAPDPAAALRAVRAALADDGVLLLLESAGAERATDNQGAAAALLYGASVLYSVPVSLAAKGRAPGMLGLPAGELRALCAEAGLGSVRVLPAPTPLNALYEIRP